MHLFYSTIVFFIAALSFTAKQAGACTGFYVKTASRILVGNNEDGSNPETRIWTVPGGEKGTYGRVYFGYNDLSPQGGINEKGLWFDAFGLPFQATYPILGDIYPGDLQDLLMAECASVNEVLSLLKKYNRSQMTRYQWMFGDREGNAIIVEADTIHHIQGNHQVVTNFRQSVFPDGNGYECHRYRTAADLLEKESDPDLDFCRKILSDTHSEGQDVTLYSYIADLTNGLIYLYHFHNFENAVVIDIKEELEKAPRTLILADLFPTTVAALTFEYRARQDLDNLKKSRLYPDFDYTSSGQFCGEYLIASPDVMSGQRLTVSRSDRSFYIQLNDGGFYDLIPDSSSSFSMIGYGGLDLKCSFRDSAGMRNGCLLLEGGGLFIEARKID